MELARLALTGLSVGDAFGERFFTSPATVLSLIAERAFPKAPWRWTDDTAMALSVVDTLERCQGIDRGVLARDFARRYKSNPMRGYGRGAHQILQHINAGLPWQAAAASVFDGQGSYGNGGAMRSAPIGAYFWDDYGAVVEHASASADPTHAHPEGKAGAIAIAIAAAVATEVAEGRRAEDGRALIETVIEHCPGGATRQGIVKTLEFPFDTEVPMVAQTVGNGADISAQDTVPLCVWSAARHLDSYEEAMWNTVSALGDRDTTCAIVGGIVALRVGMAGIPQRFVDARESLNADER
jgi:ADP-ribosylglycohydrolase